MAQPTIFQRLSQIFRGTGRENISQDIATTPHDNPYRVVYSTNDKEDYERKLSTLRQQKLLAYQWKRAGADNNMESLAAYTAVKLMYRDADLMDGSPEVGTALDIISEEACPINSNGKMINVYSSSKRTKSMLDDLFNNRLHIYTDLPMISRHMVKYGNTYMLLNIDKENGVLGWTMLPVYEVDRIENGYGAVSSYGAIQNYRDVRPDEVTFVWTGHHETGPYRNWQVAHFRLLNDSFFLPYGVSALHKARRSWRMWNMMEDSMLIWRLDKAIERRVYKIYVGNIDDSDVEAYVQEIANNFKRTQMIDPETGQVDLRKNFLDATSDYFIPVRSENAPTPIETLAAANSQVQMEDIEYMQNKMLTALRVPKTFLNFQDAQGKAQNLAILDIRFARMINRVQQFLLMELNKIAMIHLYIMGMTDEIGNFTITLNNPSSQIEAMELEDLTKRLSAMQVAVSDPGTGIPLMSLHMALKKIMKMSDSEIKEMLQEIRLEKAMAAELAATPNIIKKTGVFEPVDRIYGDFEVLNGGKVPQNNNTEQNNGMGSGGSAGLLGGGFSDNGFSGLNLGEPGSEGASDLSGEEGETGMENAASADEGMPLMEVMQRGLSNRRKMSVKSATERYFDMLNESIKNYETNSLENMSESTETRINQVFKDIDQLVGSNNDTENSDS